MSNVALAPHRHVLVVDDVDDVRRLVAQVLRRKHYRVTEADGGSAALGRLAQETVDLVVTDVRMPGMGGLELLDRVKALYPQVDVMLLTAYGTIESAVQAVRRGAIDYVTKPFDLRELEDKVARCFQAREQRSLADASPFEPLLDLDRALQANLSVPETLDAIIAVLRRVYRPAAIEITVIDGSDTSVVAQYGNLPLPASTYLPGGASIADLARQAEPWVCGSAAVGGSEMAPTEYLVIPLVHSGQVVGTVALGREAGGAPFSRAEGQLLHALGLQIGLSLLHARAHQQIAQGLFDGGEPTLDTVETLVAALGLFDHGTQVHSKRVAQYGRIMATGLGFDNVAVETISLGGLLHDIGKIGVGEQALHKNGALTQDEYNRVRQHPENGARILAGVPALAHIVPLVRHHHEAYDGQGYPDGLQGEEIPLGARVLAIVDAFDSMVSDRPYRPALPVSQALRRLESAAGTQLDASLTRSWVQIAQSDAAAIEVVRSDT